MGSLKNIFSSLFGLTKKNKNRRKKRTIKHKSRKNKTHKKNMRGG
jgi:hypothetical protein